MALSPEVRTRVIERLLPKHRAELTLGDCLGAVQAMTPAERGNLLAAFRKNRGELAGRMMQKAINELVKANAIIEADAVLSDETMSAAELERTFA